MRLREVFRYEVEYRVRSAPTYIYAGILFLVAIWMFLATADEGPGAYINSPERLAGGSVIAGIMGMLVAAAIFGEAAVRDFQVGMEPLLFTSPLRKAEYLGGRFLASLAVNAVLLVAIPLGLFASTKLAVSCETVGPFRFTAYLQPFLLLSLPNLVIAGAILFTIGMLARHVVPVYLGAIGLLIGHVVVLNYAPQIDSPILAALADPSGIGAVQEVTRYWTEVESNTRLSPKTRLPRMGGCLRPECGLKQRHRRAPESISTFSRSKNLGRKTFHFALPSCQCFGSSARRNVCRRCCPALCTTNRFPARKESCARVNV